MERCMVKFCEKFGEILEESWRRLAEKLVKDVAKKLVKFCEQYVKIKKKIGKILRGVS